MQTHIWDHHRDSNYSWQLCHQSMWSSVCMVPDFCRNWFG
jgi:hypothetical protein